LGSEADGDGAGHGVISWRIDAGSVQDHPRVGQGGKMQGAGDEDESRRIEEEEEGEEKRVRRRRRVHL
jgi:hypothetical protein